MFGKATFWSFRLCGFLGRVCRLGFGLSVSLVYHWFSKGPVVFFDI